MRLPGGAAVAGGTLVLALGVTGLIRGVVPQSAGSTPAAPIVVSGAYIRPPVPPTELAAAYFTVTNTTGTDDLLTSVTTSAGAESVVHQLDADGVMSVAATGSVVPAHGTLVLSVGKAHLMIGKLSGKMAAGEKVTIDLRFQNSPAVEIQAPVVPFGQPAPTPSGGSK